MTAVRAGIELSIKPPIDAIRAKPVSLTEYALELSDMALASLGVSVGSPLGPCRVAATGRWSAGSAHPHPRARRWPGGHRLPGAHVIRFGLSPLSSTFAGVLAGVGAIPALLLE
jgi:kynureninase